MHVCAVRMTLHRADVLEAYLNGQDNIQKATVYERTGDVVLTYRGSRKDAAALLAAYRFVLSFNSALILLGALGILPPATSAMLHNLSTLGISLRSMTDLLEQKPSL